MPAKRRAPGPATRLPVNDFDGRGIRDKLSTKYTEIDGAVVWVLSRDPSVQDAWMGPRIIVHPGPEIDWDTAANITLGRVPRVYGTLPNSARRDCLKFIRLNRAALLRYWRNGKWDPLMLSLVPIRRPVAAPRRWTPPAILDEVDTGIEGATLLISTARAHSELQRQRGARIKVRVKNREFRIPLGYQADACRQLPGGIREQVERFVALNRGLLVLYWEEAMPLEVLQSVVHSIKTLPGGDLERAIAQLRDRLRKQRGELKKTRGIADQKRIELEVRRLSEKLEKSRRVQAIREE